MHFDKNLPSFPSLLKIFAILDSSLAFSKYITNRTHSFYFQLWHIRVQGRIQTPWPTCRLKCLDRVLQTAARLVGRIPRFDRVSGYMRDVLHWLPNPQRIVYRISPLVQRCIEGLAPSYLRELCCSTVTIQRRISLRSSAQAELLVPRTRTVIRQRRAFSVAGPTA